MKKWPDTLKERRCHCRNIKSEKKTKSCLLKVYLCIPTLKSGFLGFQRIGKTV